MFKMLRCRMVAYSEGKHGALVRSEILAALIRFNFIYTVTTYIVMNVILKKNDMKHVHGMHNFCHLKDTERGGKALL